MKPLKRKSGLAHGLAAATAFHLAYAFGSLAWLMVFYLGGLAVLTGASTARRAFYAGAAVGLCVFVPQMTFLWTLFGPLAIPLWLVLAFWIGMFVLLGHLARRHMGERTGWALMPFLWLGLEYFRSELYYLKFSWISPGLAFWEWPHVIAVLGGVYGVGFWLMLLVAFRFYPWPHARRRVTAGTALVASLCLVVALSPFEKAPRSPRARTIQVAGLQMEFPAPHEVLEELDKLVAQYPAADLLVLSEYTFDGPIPSQVLAWCHLNKRHLIAGGKDELGDGRYYNTAFVVDPSGKICFQQAKCTPIQFFKDGLPAKEQRVWNSPWGKIGICICYDFSFTRVTDELIRQGAEAIIIPTMDVTAWGRHQHELHARVGAVRAAEYRVPVLRVCSSGISQVVNRFGQTLAFGSFPGDREQIAGTLNLATSGTMPPDRFAALFAVIAVGGVILAAAVVKRRNQPFAAIA